MTGKQRARLLARAVLLIDEAQNGLDTSAYNCDCCGLKRFRNFGDEKLHRRLSALADSLDAIAVALDGKDLAGNVSAQEEGGMA